MSTTDTKLSAFLEERKTGVGGSDAAVVAGLSPWKTPYELYLEKRGEAPEEVISHEKQQRFRFGHLLEDVIATEYTERTGRRVRRDGSMRRHRTKDWMIAHLDRKVEGEQRFLECKTAHPMAFQKGDWGDEGTSQVPDHYALQVQHYLAVTGYDVADVAVLIGAHDMRIYELPRDEQVIEMLIELEEKFWVDHVLKGVAPDMDWSHATALDLVKRTYPGVNAGEEVIMSNDCVLIHQQLMDLKASKKGLDAQIKELDARLRAEVGEAELGVLPDGTGGYRRTYVEAKDVSYTRQPYVGFRFTTKA